MLGNNNQPTQSQPTPPHSQLQSSEPKKKRVPIWLLIVIAVIVILVVLYFAAVNVAIRIAATLTVILVPILSILIIISPFILFKKIRKKFDVLTFFYALSLSLVLGWFVWRVINILVELMFEGIGEGFMSSF